MGQRGRREFQVFSINDRKASKVIHGLNLEGVWVSKPSLVKKEIFSFFKQKFVEKFKERPQLICSNINRISEADALDLETCFSKKEIKDAVFECSDDRAPGPGGFNFCFVKRFWNLLEDDFFQNYVCFFMTLVRLA
ncbi:hypothetical protein Hdeb2414_s0004g00146781 [Helianthus debilis subsp. tardiflorus]